METSPSGLPIIDLSSARGDSKSDRSAVAARVADACETTGCFYVRNHNVDQSLIDRMFRDFRSFFDQPLEYKMKYKVDFDLDRGYFPLETQNVNAFMGRLNHPNDPVEKLAFGPMDRPSYPVADNLWPDQPESLETTVRAYYESFGNLANEMMRLFSMAARAPDKEYFYRNCFDGPHSMKGNFYPASSVRNPSQHARLPAHTDITPFTILATTDDNPRSLRVKNARGDWIHADHVPGALFVNLGDIMQRWTNDKWKATEHAVVWPDDGQQVSDRQSIVYFVLMRPDAMIECVPSCVENGEKPKYEPISQKDFWTRPMNGLSLKY